MPARERLPALNTETPPQADPAAAAALAADVPTALALLRQGALTVHGRLTEASNAALYCTVEHGSLSAQAVYKPVVGERPLWDFPDGTLADRKGGHLIPAADGRVYGIDHGVTFNTEGKLRTLLWGWAGDPLPAEALEVLSRLARELEGELAERLAPHLTGAELDATRARVAALRSSGRHPLPSADWPAIPWPPV